MTNDSHPIPWSLEDDAVATFNPLRQAKIWPTLFILSVLALLILSMMMIHSATILNEGNRFFRSQFIWVVAGLGAAAVLTCVKPQVLRKWSLWGLVAILVPLAYLAVAYISNKLVQDSLRFFPFVQSIKGAIRWLRFPCPVLGSIQLQPSEFAKFFLILYLSSYYGGLSREKTKTFRGGVLTPMLLSGATCALVLLGKDLSTTVVIGATYFALMYLSGVRFRYLVCLAALGLLVGSAAIAVSPERRSRVTSYQNPEQGKDDDAYQLWRSQLALGSGGMFGRGYTCGVIKTYLPEQHTDFIVAVIGEELGFVGVVGVLSLYSLLFLSCLMIARQCRERPDMLLCLGIGLMLSLQALINIAVVSGWCPTTGVTAPFLSYGGSSMVMTLALTGLVLNVAWRNMMTIWDETLNTRCFLTTRAM